LKKYVARIFGLFLFPVKVMHWFWHKWVGLHFGQFCSQTHRITLGQSRW
jgi:hypothetical protein